MLYCNVAGNQSLNIYFSNGVEKTVYFTTLKQQMEEAS